MNDAEICRVCRCEGTPEEPLFHPCRCSGSIKHVHTNCLQSWLVHSKKPYCELCKHHFAFVPVYDPNMPEYIPTYLLLGRIAYRLSGYIQQGIRSLIVIACWVIVLPLYTEGVWRWALWSSYHTSLAFLGTKDHTFIVEEPISGGSSEGQEIAWKQAIAPLWERCVQGQLIMCIALSLSIAAFILREWVVQNAPLLRPIAPTPDEPITTGGTVMVRHRHAGARSSMDDPNEIKAPLPYYSRRTIIFSASLTGAITSSCPTTAKVSRTPLYHPPRILLDDPQARDHVSPEAATIPHSLIAVSEPCGPAFRKIKSPSGIVVQLTSGYSAACANNFRQTRRDHSFSYAHVHADAADFYHGYGRVRGWTATIHRHGRLIGRISRKAPRGRSPYHSHSLPWHLFRFFRFASPRRRRFPPPTSGTSSKSTPPLWLAPVGLLARADHYHLEPGLISRLRHPLGRLRARLWWIESANAWIVFVAKEIFPSEEIAKWGTWLSEHNSPDTLYPHPPQGVDAHHDQPHDADPLVPDAEAGIENAFEAEELAQAEAEAEADANVGAGEDLDGLLEAVGLRGPINQVIQNIFLMSFILFFVIFTFILAPHFIGRVLFTSDYFDFLLGPLRVIRIMAHPIVSALNAIWDRWVGPALASSSTWVFDRLSDSFTPLLVPFSQAYASWGLGTTSAAGGPWILQWVVDHTALVQPMDLQAHFAKLQDMTLRRFLAEQFGWSWREDSTEERLFCILLTYVLLLVLGTIITLIVERPRKAPEAVPVPPLVPAPANAPAPVPARAPAPPPPREPGALRIILLMLKVTLFIAIELILFPLGCGLLLSVLSATIITGGGIPGRIVFALSSPFSFTFIHWLIGTAFMFAFAGLVSSLRDMLRPGVLYFLRDPKDTTFSPMREILDRSALRQLRKIILSFQMYAVVIIMAAAAIHLPSLLFRLLPLPLPLHPDWDPLPLRWQLRYGKLSEWVDLTEPKESDGLPVHYGLLWWIGHVPLDLLFLQATLPLAILLRPLRVALPLMHLFLERISLYIGLSSLLYGDAHIRICERGLHGTCRSCRAMERRLGGELALVPRKDGVHLPHPHPGNQAVRDGSRPTPEVIRRRPRTPLAEGERPWVETTDYEFVIVPRTGLGRRVLYLILCMWLLLSLTIYLLILFPLTLGRRLLTLTLHVQDFPIDLLAFSIGGMFLWALAFTGYATYKVMDLLRHTSLLPMTPTLAEEATGNETEEALPDMPPSPEEASSYRDTSPLDTQTTPQPLYHMMDFSTAVLLPRSLLEADVRGLKKAQLLRILKDMDSRPPLPRNLAEMWEMGPKAPAEGAVEEAVEGEIAEEEVVEEIVEEIIEEMVEEIVEEVVEETVEEVVEGDGFEMVDRPLLPPPHAANPDLATLLASLPPGFDPELTRLLASMSTDAIAPSVRCPNAFASTGKTENIFIPHGNHGGPYYLGVKDELEAEEINSLIAPFDWTIGKKISIAFASVLIFGGQIPLTIGMVGRLVFGGLLDIVQNDLVKIFRGNILIPIAEPITSKSAGTAELAQAWSLGILLVQLISLAHQAYRVRRDGAEAEKRLEFVDRLPLSFLLPKTVVTPSGHRIRVVGWRRLEQGVIRHVVPFVLWAWSYLIISSLAVDHVSRWKLKGDFQFVVAKSIHFTLVVPALLLWQSERVDEYMEEWSKKVRDEAYIIGQELHNFEATSEGAAS